MVAMLFTTKETAVGGGEEAQRLASVQDGVSLGFSEWKAEWQSKPTYN